MLSAGCILFAKLQGIETVEHNLRMNSILKMILKKLASGAAYTEITLPLHRDMPRIRLSFFFGYG